jgi:hypothetical protein
VREPNFSPQPLLRSFSLPSERARSKGGQKEKSIRKMKEVKEIQMEIPKEIEREHTKTRKRTSACEKMCVCAHLGKPARKLGEQTRPFFYD